MSNPTSNFGWQMPTPVDLVTDLPADFEVFGQAVDSSLADLKGGTTGQILSKATNTDMDFVWITNDQGDITGITATSPLTGGGTSGAVTVGIQSASTSQSGAVQLSDSTSTTSSVLAATPTAVKSAYDLANRPNPSNPVINSAFQVWQRGTSFTSNGYSADRWYGSMPANATISRQTTGDTTNLPNIQYCARVQRNSGSTGTTGISISQSMESINSIPFAGKTITLSFYARVGANYSGGASGFISQVRSGTGTDQNLEITGYTGTNSFISNTQALTTTWTRYSYTGTVPTNATEIGIYTGFTPSGTAGANDYFEVTGVQIDVGSMALPFRTAGVTYQQELAACQRYYVRFNAGNGYGNVANSGYTASTTSVNAFFQFPVNLRTIPTAIDSSNVSYLDSAGSGTTVSSPSSAASGVSYANVAWTTSSATSGRFCWLRDSAGAGTGYVGFSAEL